MPTIHNTYSGTLDNTNVGTTLTIASVVIGIGEQLIVAACGSDGNGSGTRGEVTGVTWNGVSLTKLVESTDGLADDGIYSSFWQLANPTPGTASVVITYNGAPAHGASGYCYTIQNGLTAIDATNHAGNGSTASSPQLNSITTIADKALVIDSFIAASSGETITFGGAPQVQDYNVQPTGSSPFGGSHYTESPAGSASFSWTPSNTGRGWCWTAISIAPSAANKTLNNYQFIKAGSGISVSEKIK
ncbi:MAG: hypothetical protein KGI08_09665 [Thaumarchaeota archaeon]|nr:hypothetical protein [Nitrososphaerota archaeon]